VGTYRSHIDANRSAVRALVAAHKSPMFGGLCLGTSSRRTEEQELPQLEPPAE
jgi:hypothetical protein